MKEENDISRLARITNIATMLQSKRIVTAASIAKKFDISVRTVYRDIRTLESSGVPVITIDGKGYSIMDGYTLPPIMFTEAEANALITAEHLINNTKDASLTTHFQEALVKIKSVIRSAIRAKSDLLSDRILILGKGKTDKTSHSLSDLQLAITSHRVTRIIYQKPDDSPAIARYIEPQVICYLNENWILIAWCRLRNDFRAFRIDRMRKIEFQDTTFHSRDAALKAYFASWPENIF
jgi:predicted DNA-binding transcriptional regulator YafY